MVLGYLLKGLHEMKHLKQFFCCALLGSVFFWQPALADSHTDDSAHIISSFTLSLQNDEGKCVLTADKEGVVEQKITLLLDTPCYWVSTEKTPSTEPLNYSYPEKKVDAVLLVAGGELDWSDEKKKYHKLPTDQICNQYLQGVIISDNEISAVDEKMDAPHCSGLIVDEKVFRQAMDIEVRYQEVSSSQAEATATELEIAEPKEESLFGSIQKTIKNLFTSED
jgi:hypothetical protein